MEVWVILTINGGIWGVDAFASEELARAELHNFFKDKKMEAKFQVVHVKLREAITGDYAGMGRLSD